MSDVQLHCGDCLDVMPSIPEGSIDLILADPPYGTTACKWDSVIPLEPMWAQLKRVIKPNGAIVMTASQPFTTTLIASNIKMFKYHWVWEKSRATGFLQAGYMPLKAVEDVCVFCADGKTYFAPINTSGHKPTNMARGESLHTIYNGKNKRDSAGGKTSRHPRNMLEFNSERGLHPTQKPVALMEYMIRTYTNEGETVLDFTMGSGTTGVACQNTGRDFIGIEKDEPYFKIAKDRLEENEWNLI